MCAENKILLLLLLYVQKERAIQVGVTFKMLTDGSAVQTGVGGGLFPEKNCLDSAVLVCDFENINFPICKKTKKCRF